MIWAVLFVVVPPAELVVKNARLRDKPLTALALAAGTIVAEGDVAAFIGPATRVIDAGGHSVLPGFVDAHGHMAGLGQMLDMVDLRMAASEADVVKAVAARAKAQKPGTWVVGRGWDQNRWPGQAMPTHAALSLAVPKHPVVLYRVDGHAAWANAAALKLAKISDKTVAPKGGQILLDDKSKPSGVLIDNAMSLLEAVRPHAMVAQHIEALTRAQNEVLSHGIVMVHDMGVSQAQLEAYAELQKRKALRVRIYAALDGGDRQLLDRELPKKPRLDPMFTVRSVKLYADGALGSRGAQLISDYSDAPHERGLAVSSPKELGEVVALCRKYGFQAAVHAIGDQANRTVLDVFEATQVAKEERHRIEHAQIVDPTDRARFKNSEIIASMQPTHATSDMPWAPARLGNDRLAGAYSWKSLMQGGVRLAFGSDFPVEDPSVLAGLWSATTRQNWNAEPLTGWLPNERLSIDEALDAFTLGAHYASFTENEAGRIAVGQRGDLVILDGDVKKDDLRKLRVTHTIVNGVVAYQR